MSRTFESKLTEGRPLDERPYPLAPQYIVREDGAVRHVDGTWKKQFKLKRGQYLAVSLWLGSKSVPCPVHILVALAFHGPRPSPKHDAAHNDGVKDNCHKDNIQWKTHTENEADKVRHGTSNRGSRNGMATLTPDAVLSIRADTRVQRVIAAEHGIDQSMVSNIKRRKAWAHL